MTQAFIIRVMDGNYATLDIYLMDSKTLIRTGAEQSWYNIVAATGIGLNTWVGRNLLRGRTVTKIVHYRVDKNRHNEIWTKIKLIRL